MKELETIVGPGRLKQNEPHAKYYLETENQDEFIKITKAAINLKIPIFIIGSGTWTKENKYLDGLVIKNNCHRFELMSFRGTIKSQKIGLENVLVYAQAGTNLNQLVRFTINEGLSGLEYQLGQPGTVGDAIYTKVKYEPKNKYVLDSIDTIKLLNSSSEIEDVDRQYFAKREVTDIQPAEEVILSVTFQMKPEDKKLLWKRAQEAVEYRNNNFK